GRFSGTLPVANGGTNASTFTAGSVVFAGSGGTYSQDNSNLFFDDSNNRLGIGTASPKELLHIVKSSNPRFDIGTTDNYSTSKTIYITIATNTNVGNIESYNYSTNTGLPLILNPSGGYVGIGTTPAVQLHTTGGVRFAGLTSITDLRTDADGDLYNGGSDVNLKNNIEPITYGLNEVLKIKPVEFYWNKEKYNYSGYKTIGFIAQDLMDIIPNAATVSGDGNMQIEYTAIIATLTKAIQEQQALIKALEQRIINLENK
ncbi:tail fiber domain-containing protein, partial [bacterium]|nr:tail fiber domain-containing protein [bacterium]